MCYFSKIVPVLHLVWKFNQQLLFFLITKKVVWVKHKYLLNDTIKLSKFIAPVLMHRIFFFFFSKNVASLACLCWFVDKTSKQIGVNLIMTAHSNARKSVPLGMKESVKTPQKIL